LYQRIPSLQDENVTINADLDRIIADLPGFQADIKTGIDRKQIYQKWRSVGMEVMDNMIRQAALIPCNIMFETTGYSVSWTIPLIRQLISHGYHIVLMFPLVQERELVRRAEAREKSTGQIAAPAYSTTINGKTIPGIIEIYEKASKNLAYLIPMIDELFLIDNNGASAEEAKIILHMHNKYRYSDQDQDSPGVVRKVSCPHSEKQEIYHKYILDLLKRHCKRK
jgi:predicted ABC-type ATPase